MCNLYSITTNKPPFSRPSRVVNRHVAKPAANAGCIPRLSGAGRPQHRHRYRDGNHTLGHASTAAHARGASHEHPQHLITALAHVAQAGEPLPGPS